MGFPCLSAAAAAATQRAGLLPASSPTARPASLPAAHFQKADLPAAAAATEGGLPATCLSAAASIPAASPGCCLPQGPAPDLHPRVHPRGQQQCSADLLLHRGQVPGQGRGRKLQLRRPLLILKPGNTWELLRASKHPLGCQGTPSITLGT